MAPFLRVICRDRGVGSSCSLSGASESWQVAHWGPELSSGPYISPAATTVVKSKLSTIPTARSNLWSGKAHVMLCGLSVICLTSCAFLDITQEHGSLSLLTSNCPHHEVTCQLSLQEGWHQMITSWIPLHRFVFWQKEGKRSSFAIFRRKILATWLTL